MNQRDFRLSEIQSYHTQADKIEERIISENEQEIYAGIFRKGASDDTPNGCIIRKITIVKNDNVTTTEIKYAEGKNMAFDFCWNKKEDYDYEYSAKP
jgi:hypothetical protein